MDSELHVVMCPFLAFGHISPFLQLARKISSCAASGGVRVTFLSAAANVPRIESLLPASTSISVVPLHLPAVPGLPPGVESTADLPPTSPAAELLKLAVDGTRPQVESLLRELRPHLAVFDFCMQWLPEVAEPLGVRTLFFSVFAAVSTAYLTVPARRLHGPAPTLGDMMSPPPGFPSAASSIRSVPAYQAADFLYIFKSFGGGVCVYERVVKCIESCSAIVAKTCTEMEGPYIDYIERQFGKPMLLAGPVVPAPLEGKLEARWAKWLGGFAEGTVVFSSFGSETFLTDEGERELLLGLEMTGMPFLVVLNRPKSGTNGEHEEVRKRLPEGFEERHILRHKSVGCFVCHAGLSSVMEGVAAGCQLAMMPQKGDQFLNAALFARDLGIGVEVERKGEDGGFTRESVCAAVRKVMVAKVRKKHGKWREFLLEKELQDGFTAKLVERLRQLAKA
ncbi:UDP-glucoronosyl and UDP-glucosyl transferase [Musa troglodytarum]|uniref:UDP-glucoronosyl and UDP-glucosyl transferase n=1 Tax=Musa troglodytarum TaxID=320322 RepID=A0A9E7HLE8_9LILI|nr:UDP-glucoronosyl and UDP-glucosyl transferase [Musa troglodytarum]